MHCFDALSYSLRSAAEYQTFIVSSHNLDEIEDLCQSVIILREGRLAKYQPLAELVERTTSLAIPLERALPDSVRAAIAAPPAVKSVEIDSVAQSGVLVTYAEAEGNATRLDVLQLLQRAGIDFLEIKRGRSLGQKMAAVSGDAEK